MVYKFRAYGRDILTPKLKEVFEEILYDRLMPFELFHVEPRKPLPWWKQYLNRASHFNYRLHRAWLVLTDREEWEE